MHEKTPINLVLAENLAYWMGEAEMTQAALADKAGVSQKTISNYLNPEQRDAGISGKEPSAKLTELAKIAEALNIGVWQLVRKMTESERLMYEAIEKSYAGVQADAVAVAQRAAEASRLRALRNAEIPKGAARKSAKKA